MTFRAGSFRRSSVAAPWRAFCPVESVLRLDAVEPEALRARGKRLILLDVDNTLTHWKSEQIEDAVRDWVDRARRAGLELCILSNTRRAARLERLSKDLGIPAIRGRFKPSRQMYLDALDRFAVPPEAAVMIGDQLLTDVFGANRTGIDAIWLQPLSDAEFAGTKISRWIERALVAKLYNALASPVDAEPAVPAVEARKPFLDRTIVRQFVKFVVVGGTSFVIDAGLSNVLVAHAFVHGRPLDLAIGGRLLAEAPWLARLPAPIDWFPTPAKAGASPLFALASLVAMVNSFIWNRRWTFETRGPEERLAQLRRFFVVSIVGYVIQVSIASGVFARLAGSSGGEAVLAKACGAAVAALWNFGGQRLYAFRRSR